MPKLKTNRGAAKRFKVRKSGEVKAKHANAATSSPSPVPGPEAEAPGTSSPFDADEKVERVCLG